MSQIATFIICKKNKQQYFSSRHDGLYLDRTLLKGPESFVLFTKKCKRLDNLILEPQLSGYAEVDLDQRRLRYWGTQGFGVDSVSQRMYRAMLQIQWPGWQLEWLSEPAITLDCAGHVMSTCDWTASEVQAMQAQEWNAWKQASLGDIEKNGEAVARAKVETMWNGFNTWLTVRTEQGLRDALLYNQCWPEQSIFLLGEELLDVFAVRPNKSLDDEDFVESEIRMCCFIDTVEHKVFWWAKERMLTVFNLQEAWAGWKIHVLADGPKTQLELTGRPSISLLSTVCLHKMEDTWLAELLGMQQNSQQPSSWENQILDHYYQILRTPAFQAQKIIRDSDLR